MAKGTRSSNDYRKLQNIKKDLMVLKKELAPEEKDKVQEKELASFDNFQRKKHELNTLLQEIRVDVDRLNEMRKKLGDDGRDDLTIRLSSENNARLQQATDLFSALKRILEKDEKKKGKKLSEKDLADRRQFVILLGREIVTLTNANSKNKRVITDEEQQMADRVAARKREQEEKIRVRRERLKKARKSSKKKSGGRSSASAEEDLINEEEFKDIAAKTEQELAFEARVEQNYAEQDKMLNEIIVVLNDLEVIAQEANKHLVQQDAMLQQVDDQMEKAIVQYKAANKRLKSILEESGGMSRWCPMIICAIFLLALVGYFVGLVH